MPPINLGLLLLRLFIYSSRMTFTLFCDSRSSRAGYLSRTIERQLSRLLFGTDVTKALASCNDKEAA
jgi:hypothetical protein